MNGHFVVCARNLVTIIVSIVLIVVILMQTKGSSFSGSLLDASAPAIHSQRLAVESRRFLLHNEISAAGIGTSRISPSIWIT